MSNSKVASKKIQGWVESPSEPKIPKEGTMAYTIYIDKLKRLEREQEEKERIGITESVEDAVDNLTDSVDKGQENGDELGVSSGTCVQLTHDTVETHDTYVTHDLPGTHNTLVTHDIVVTHDRLPTHDPQRTHDRPATHDPITTHDAPATHDRLETHDLPITHHTGATHDVSPTHDPQAANFVHTPPNPVLQQAKPVNDAPLRVASTHVPLPTLDPSVTHDPPRTPDVQAASRVNPTHDPLQSHVQNRPKRNLPKLAKLTQTQTIAPDPSPVHITYNYSYRDRDLTKYMSMLTGDEWKVYCYLLSLTHEEWEGQTHCWTSQYVVAEETGIGTRKTAGLVLESLEAKGLIQRTYKGGRIVKMSQYRVFLPCELAGYDGKTKIAYIPRTPKKPS